MKNTALFATSSLLTFSIFLTVVWVTRTNETPHITSRADPASFTQTVESEESKPPRSKPAIPSLEAYRTYNELRSRVLRKLSEIEPITLEKLESIVPYVEKMMPSDLAFTIVGEELIARGLSGMLIELASTSSPVAIRCIPALGRACVSRGKEYLDSVRLNLEAAGMAYSSQLVDTELAQELIINGSSNPERFGEKVEKSYFRLKAKSAPYQFIEQLNSQPEAKKERLEPFRRFAIEELTKQYRLTSKSLPQK